MYVPEVEYFFDVPYKAYCGNCKRLMFILRRGANIEDVRDHYLFCPWCGQGVDWEGLKNG